MGKHGKRYAEALKLVDQDREYEPAEAVAVLKSMPRAKFNETIELHLRLNVDPRHADQQVRSTVMLPSGTGQQVRVMAFVEGEAVRLAQEAGAEYVGTDEFIERIQGGWTDFDATVATPQVMGKVGRLGRVLGPRGLMPNPRTGTVVPAEDIGKAIQELKQGRVEFRTDRTANLHIPVGKISFGEQEIMANLTAVMNAIIAARPASAKGQYIKSVTLTATMSPGLPLNITAASTLRAA
ncbi:MAG: 50S ribosomal protein L1 [Anaerolineae bacterium]